MALLPISKLRGVGGGIPCFNKKRPNLMTHQSKNINLLYIYIYQFYNCDTFLEQSISYNYVNNFFQTLNAAFSVITFLVEN